MCKHDQLYQIEHESAGGVGCPICNAERRLIHADKCPVCGLSLTEHPHSEAECEALLAYDEAGFYDAQAEIAQARIDYRYSSQ